MHSATTIGRPKGRLNISDVGPRFGSTKLAAGSTKRAAGAPHIRAFCECVGVCAIRAALILAVLSALLLIAARPAHAQETVLYNFTGGSDGGGPMSGLTFDAAGNLYGTTYFGGLACAESQYGCGTVFELSPNGNGGWNETVLYSFTGGADGAYPNSDVIFDSVGNLYGTAYEGGVNGCGYGDGCGIVFELSPVGTSWTETVLLSFTGSQGDGGFPQNGVIMDPAGNLYGTTCSCGAGYGTLFKLSPSGGGWTEQVLTGADGFSGLTMDPAGDIFGAWLNEDSTVFELSPIGNLTEIHTFTGAPKDGSDAEGTPVLDQAGNLYGTTLLGGAKNLGTVYKLSPVKKGKKKGEWTEKILYSFKGGKDGCGPTAGIVFGAAGNIYGTTTWCGYENMSGTVFELVAPVGKGGYKEKVLLGFNGTGGAKPYGSLILDSAGNLYGTASRGGSSGWGVVFEVTP
jgi:uncharacterized repeat protein (TIGR03803 family)